MYVLRRCSPGLGDAAVVARLARGRAGAAIAACAPVRPAGLRRLVRFAVNDHLG